MKKIISITLLIAVVITMAITASAGSLGQKHPKGDVALVDAGSITIDGVKDAAYADGAVIVTDTFQKNNVSENGTMNTTYLLWDGVYLYLFTEAKDNTPLEASLVTYLAKSYNTECVEYFIVWDNSDCPELVTYEPDTSLDLYQYRACYEDSGRGGYFENCATEYAGFANGAEDTHPFSDEPGMMTAGWIVPTASGYNVEVQITMPKSNRAGFGDYNYGDGWKIAFIVQQFDWTVSCGDYDNLTAAITEVGTPSGEVMINKSTAWDSGYYDYVELKGTVVPADTTTADTTTADTATAAPDTQDNTPADTNTDTTKAPAQSNPQTSDMAVAGVAVFATLALAGVVVAKKVR